MEKRFVADVHLGKLARWLRLLGFDTAYRNDYSFTELANIAKEENRVLLSRNPALAKHTSFESLIITGEQPMEQLQQVIARFDLRGQMHPFSRCMVCNGLLEKVEKDQVVGRLEPNTTRFYDEFWRCHDCRCTYWKGAHYQRMQKRLVEAGL